MDTHTLTNRDLFLFLRSLNSTLIYHPQLFNFIVQKLDFDFSEDSEDKVKYYLQMFCKNLSFRWKQSNRRLKVFERKNDLWLNKEFKIPDKISGECSNVSVPSTCHRKTFSECTERHKRRRTQVLRESYSTDILLHATRQKLESDDSLDMAKILDYLTKNPSETKRIRAFCEGKINIPLYSKEKCLALMLNLNLSKSQYMLLSICF